MPYPTLHDDGQTVTLDLHGATVEEALDLTTRVLSEAAHRGRSTVKLIHGHGADRPGRPALKPALHDAVTTGPLSHLVVSTWPAEGHLLLSLDVTAAPDSTPLRMLDLL